MKYDITNKQHLKLLLDELANEINIVAEGIRSIDIEEVEPFIINYKNEKSLRDLQDIVAYHSDYETLCDKIFENAEKKVNLKLTRNIIY